jgi:hypothetical protein
MNFLQAKHNLRVAAVVWACGFLFRRRSIDDIFLTWRACRVSPRLTPPSLARPPKDFAGEQRQSTGIS